METIDLKREHKDLYTATAKVKEVVAGRATFLSVDGRGAPGGPTFEEAIGKLYALAYTAKFTLKYAGVTDFRIPCLECLWLSDPATTPKDAWAWRLLLRIPDAVTARLLAKPRSDLAERKGLDTSGVKRIAWREGRALQVLHVGPYDEEGKSYARLAAAAEGLGLVATGPAHDIYISDPRRVAPAKLKTILRMPVGAARARARIETRRPVRRSARTGFR